MFIKRVKHYHQWLHTAIPLKTKSGQIPSDSVRIQGPSKRPSSGHLYPVSSVKECNRKVRKCKIAQVLQSPVSSPQASPKVEAGHRPNQAQQAVSLALRSFKDQCQNQTVLVATDNSTVVAYINKQGGTHSAEMCALLWRIMTWCHHCHINIESQTHSRVSECDG